MFDVLVSALGHLATLEFWGYFFVALGLATVVGLLPGVGGTMTMAIVLPIIVIGIDDPAIGVLMLAVITGTSNTFDSIPAQLMGIVNAGTQVTFLEGHQLTRKGLGAYSLGAVYAVSAIGGLVGAFCLLLAIPFIKPLILSMSFGEIAMLALFGIMMVAILSRGAAIKGVVSGLLGLLAATVGLQVYTGVERFTFGSFQLKFGLPLVATVLGFMAIPEIIDLAVSRLPVAPKDAVVSTREVFRGFREGLRRWKMAVRHSVIGVALGALPGTGASVVTWINYGIGMSLTKDKSEFGKGSLDGLLFAESSENAKEGGQAIPTLALGIPGSTSWALVIVAMIAYGIVPGPRILDEHSDIIGLIVISFAVANLILTLLALLITRQLMRVTLIPYPVIAGVIMPVVLTGAFFDDRTFVIFPIMLVFALLGIVMKQYGWPRPPFLLAFILGPIIEDNLHDAISVHGFVGFITRPLTIGLFIGSVLVILLIQYAISRGEDTAAEVITKAEGDASGEVSLGDDVDFLVAIEEEGTLERERQVMTGAELESGDGVNVNRFGWYWRSEHLLPIGFVILGILTVMEALSFNRAAAMIIPIGTSVGIVILSAIQLLTQARSPIVKKANIMDMDVRSMGVAGAKSSAVKVTAVLGVYAGILVLFGIIWSSLFLAVAIPFSLLERRRRYTSSLVSLVLVGLFLYYVGDRMLAIIWPGGLLN